MQALKNLFSRAQVQNTGSQPLAQTTQPTELSADSLKLVGGGLPRVGGLGGSSAIPETGPAAASLPSVS